MNATKLFAFLLTAGFLASCVTDTSGTATIADNARINEIVVGTSTREQVLASIGEPLSRSLIGGIGGSELWTYQYSRTSINAATFIPVVQLAAGGGESDLVTMIVTFESNGVVQNVVRSCSRTTTQMLGRDRFVSVDC